MSQFNLIENVCQSGNCRKLRSILTENRVNLVNQSNDEGLYPIHISVIYQEWPTSEELLSILSENGADLTLVDKRCGDNLLHLVLRFNSSFSARKLVPFLMKKGCDPYSKNYSGKSFMDMAKENGYFNLTHKNNNPSKENKKINLKKNYSKKEIPKKSELIKEEIDLNLMNSNKLLIESVKNGDPELIKKSLKDGADPNVKDQNHYCPIHYSVSKNQAKPVEILKLLNTMKTDMNALTEEGDSVITLAVKKIAKEDVCTEVIGYLKTCGVSDTVKDQDGYDALTLSKMRKFTYLPMYFSNYKITHVNPPSTSSNHLKVREAK